MIFALYIASIILTLGLGAYYRLANPWRLGLFAGVFPLVGFLYALYVIYVVRPRVMAAALGLPPQPNPYIAAILNPLRQGLNQLLGRKNTE